MKTVMPVAATAVFALSLTALAFEVTKDDFKCLEGMTIMSCITDRSKHVIKVDEATSATSGSIDGVVGTSAESASGSVDSFIWTSMASFPAIRLNTNPRTGLTVIVR